MAEEQAERLRRLVEESRGEVEREIRRLEHVRSVWDLTMLALQRKPRGGGFGLRKLRALTGLGLAGVRHPRNLKETGKPGTDLLRLVAGTRGVRRKRA